MSSIFLEEVIWSEFGFWFSTNLLYCGFMNESIGTARETLTMAVLGLTELMIT